MLRPSRFYAVLVASAAALLFHAALEARPCRPLLIPHGEVNQCFTCHLSSAGGGPRNAFGRDVEMFVTPGLPCETDTFWGPVLAALDSDGDGRTNGEELQDPAGAWSPGDPDPGDPLLVTHPGIADDPVEVADFLRGDANGDGRLDLSDPIFTLNHLFRGGPAPPCREAANANGDRNLDLGDPIWTLGFIFYGRSPPPPPFPACAPGAVRIDCAAPPPCI